MKHLCDVPRPVRAGGGDTNPGIGKTWECSCGLVWRLNPIVLQWFLDTP